MRRFADKTILLAGCVLVPVTFAVLVSWDSTVPLSFADLPALATTLAVLACVMVLVRPALARISMPAGVVFAMLVGALFALAQRTVWGDWPGIPWSWMGIFPRGDSGDYFNEALGLLVDGGYESLRGRPLHTAGIAALLRLTDFNLPRLGVLMSAMAAASTFCASVAVWRTHGLAAASVLAAMMFAFFHYFVGSLMTEPSGFIYGGLAFAIIWSSVARDRAAWYIAGVAALTLALCVRVGPMFVLGGVALYAAFAWRGPRVVNLRLALACVLVTVGLLAAHSAYNRVLSPASGGSFANAADSIYRLVVQGEARLGRYPASKLRNSAPWLQIYDDHPGLAEKSQTERVRDKQAILFDAVSRSPLALAAGALPEWNEYFFDFQFLPFISIYNNDASALFMAIVAALGLLRILMPGRDRYLWFVLVTHVAIFASVPFLIGGQTRVYAATIGFTGALAALGVYTLTNWRVGFSPEQARLNAAIDPVAVTAAVVLVLLTSGTVVASISLGGTFDERTSGAECGPTEMAVRGILSRGIMVTADTNATPGEAMTPDALASAAAGNRKLAPVTEAKLVWAHYQRSQAAFAVYYFADFSTRRGTFAVSRGRQTPTVGRIQTFCKMTDGGLIQIRDAG